MGSVRLSEELRQTIRRNAKEAFRAGNIEPVMANENQELLITAVENTPIQKAARKMDEYMGTFGLKRTMKRSQEQYLAPHKQHPGESGYSRNPITLQAPKLCTFSNGTISFQWHESLIPDEWRARSTNFAGELNFTKFDLENPYRKMQFYSDEYNDYYSNVTVDLSTFEEDHVAASLEVLLKSAERNYLHLKKQREFEAQIRNLLEECNTLKQAIDAWPGVREFAPTDTLQQMYKKNTSVQTAKKGREEINIDPG